MFKTVCLFEVIIIVMEIMVFLSHDFWSSMLPYTYAMTFKHNYSVYLLGDEWFHTHLYALEITFSEHSVIGDHCQKRPFTFNISILDTRNLMLHVKDRTAIWNSIIHMILLRFGSEFDVNPLQCNRYADSFLYVFVLMILITCLNKATDIQY